MIEGIAASGTTAGTHSHVADALALPEGEVSRRVEAGESGPVNAFKRRVRWMQQTLKQHGLVRNTRRGHWELTGRGRRSLALIRGGHMRIACMSSSRKVTLFISIARSLSMAARQLGLGPTPGALLSARRSRSRALASTFISMGERASCCG
ncbi:hypothetical protein J2T57_001641 [Natronocella acetinitrilica]|uniref:Restriction system protein Mrr-like N-terminal domain-containing protein n=1 Tax=Natronocella acetinitrilica TaxID=414046 RepID=A0AAE3KB94_9GAMM|nr:hypothetical protein [Natronocella acetinitrilica]